MWIRRRNSGEEINTVSQIQRVCGLQSSLKCKTLDYISGYMQEFKSLRK